ncbi:MAG: Tex-like N-terminal domain-containing protein, partial [Planctomycetota bacterium]|nr:Tex-like N-terminal domain-containing protein [Planctomycetota bacterium]
MTATHILEALAREFSSSPERVHAVLEMLDAGLTPPLIGRFRRADTGELPESVIRRIQRDRTQLEEMDRRRATILRTLEGSEGVGEKDLEGVRKSVDRFELEDLLLPHRRPEPEVQLALDRGLGELADLLVAPYRKSGAKEMPEPGDVQAAPEVQAPSEAAAVPETGTAGQAEPAQETDGETQAQEPGEEATSQDSADGTPSPATEPESAPVAPAGQPTEEARDTQDKPATSSVALKTDEILTPELARACQEFVRPDRGIHTEAEALAGAMRILADRLSRDPRLRGLIRRMLRKRGVLSVRSLVPDNKAGRHRSLMKLRQPMRQLQGHRLLALRQAQKERVLTTAISLEREVAMPKVLAALSRHRNPAFEGVLGEVARRALEVRILPMLEGDIRLELKERGDDEALRFLAQHLRQVLLTPPCGRHPVAAVDVSARGDWLLVTVDESGEPAGSGTLIEIADKDAAALGAELKTALGESRARTLAVGHGKVPRAAVPGLRAALAAAGLDLVVHVVFDSGLTHYANSEGARKELPDASVAGRVALALARRLQDPLQELLKVEPRYLGLGVEQGFVSKANLKRTYREVIESCAALVGCDVNRASAFFLGFIPGLTKEAAGKLAERAKQTPFKNREELRGEGLLSEAEWANAVAFLRVPNSDEPLDRTGLHPEQYPLARRLLEAAGVTAQEGLGRSGLTRGLRRDAFEVDEYTWRDLMREISHPGRDPRPRLPLVRLLEGPVDPVR